MAPEQTRSQILSKLSKNLPATVEFALLFGSAQLDKMKPDSDVDLGLYLDQWPLREGQLATLKDDFAKLLERDCDLVILNEADPIITAQILNTGELIHCRNRDFFVQFRARKISEYIDFKQSRKVIEDTLTTHGWPFKNDDSQ